MIKSFIIMVTAGPVSHNWSFTLNERLWVTAKTQYSQGHRSYAALNQSIPGVPTAPVIWFCFPARAISTLQFHITSPGRRRRPQIESSGVTAVLGFIVTGLAFLYQQGPLGNSFMERILITRFGNKPFHSPTNPFCLIAAGYKL